MAEGTFIVGVFVAIVTAIGVAVSPIRQMALVAGIGLALLPGLIAWLAVFRLLFGVAS